MRPHSGPVELQQPSGASIVPPDQTFFNDLNGELTDQGFLVTTAEDLFTWARTGSPDIVRRSRLPGWRRTRP